MTGVACASWVAAAGCYSSQQVAPQAVASAGTRLSSNLVLPTRDGGRATLAPSTKVRIHTRDGRIFAWHDGGDLTLLPDGLASSDLHAFDETREAFVAGLTPAEVERLRALAPVDGHVEAGGGRQTIFTAMMDEGDAAAYSGMRQNPLWLRLRADAPGALVSWLGRFTTETASGRWALLDGRHRPLAAPVAGADLAAADPLRHRVVVGAGARWSDISYLELRALESAPHPRARHPRDPSRRPRVVRHLAVGG